MTLLSSNQEIKPDLKEQPELNGTALDVRDVSLIFPDGDRGLHVLADISFSVQTEEFVCIIGPSGSGKSTLLRVLAGLLSPTQGEVYFNGQRVDELTVPKARELGVETVYQERALAELQTLWRNIYCQHFHLIFCSRKSDRRR